MKPERAKEVIQQAQAQAKKSLGVMGIMAWSDQLDKVMTPEERQFVLDYWKKMPSGSSSFVDALYSIARNREAEARAVALKSRGRECEAIPVVYHECSDGKWYYCYGIPFGVKTTGKTRIEHYALFDKKTGTTFGQRAGTKEEAEARHRKYLDEQVEDFYQALLKMDDREFQSQKTYWENV